jgi:hypothetical protein
MDLKEIMRAAVATGASQKELATAYLTAQQQDAFDKEHATAHPLASHSLSEGDWALMRNHMLDGAGVDEPGLALEDGQSLEARILRALDANDQVEFWKLLPHVVKSHLKKSGHIRAIPGGAVVRGAHGNPAMDKMRADAKARQEGQKEVPGVGA